MIKTRNIAAFFSWFCLLSSGSLSVSAENIGEYGKADVEVDRSVLQDINGYEPPPMFGTPPSERVIIPPPEAPKLTAPDTKTLLDHPVENHHVLTIQRQQSTDNSKALPIPEHTSKTGQAITLPPEIAQDKIPPVPSHKPKAPSSAPAVAEKPKEFHEINQEHVHVKEPYKPVAPKSMPAVPQVKVEAKPLSSFGNLPLVPPENIEKPSIGERLMDDALTRNMIKNEDDVRESMGVPTATILLPVPEEEQKTTDLPEIGDLNEFSMACKTGEIEIVKDQKYIIDQNVTKRLLGNKLTRLEIRSYASRTDGTESSARRISLSRALSVRSYLLEKGISPTRIDVRALSDKTTDPQTDRIDMIFVETK